MSRNRFELLLAILHFSQTDEENSTDRLHHAYIILTWVRYIMYWRKCGSFSRTINISTIGTISRNAISMELNFLNYVPCICTLHTKFAFMVEKCMMTLIQRLPILLWHYAMIYLIRDILFLPTIGIQALN